MSRHNTTEFIYLNGRLCEACWKCIETCPNGVIGKINMPFHKHVRIGNPDRCKGCQECVNVCQQHAINAY